MLGVTSFVGRAFAAEPTLADEVLSLAAQAEGVFKLDSRLYSMMIDDPVSLTASTREYEVIDLENYADPTTATMRVTEGAILLRDPSELGGIVRYRYQGADGEWVRDAEGRYLTSTWYGTADGRIARVIRNADGHGVGTYTLDPVMGGYEVALDLDADAVVDVHDVLTSDGHEQMSVTALGREWADQYLSGFNALCYSVDLGGTLGDASFGAGADARATMPGCNLSRGGRAGGFSGSLGTPSGPTNPIDALCAQLGGKDHDGAESDLRDRLEDSRQASGCTDQCSRELTACMGACGNVPLPARGECIDFCLGVAMQCDGQCEEEVAVDGETTEPPPPPAAPEPTAAGAPSRFHDTDGDGVVDSEDTDGDDVPDLTCGGVGCTDEAYPPIDGGGLGGDDWEAFCSRDEHGLPDAWGSFEDAAGDGCPDPLGNPAPNADGKGGESKGGGDFAYLDVCGAPPKDQDLDDVLWDTEGVCDAEPRGCGPETLFEKRMRLMQSNAGIVAFRCDDVLCQPLPF
ncbi:MAG: hypothetical protein ABMA64_27415 [Myxococcota bacterium]